jgi:polysaccharide export outer membrane protein
MIRLKASLGNDGGDGDALMATVRNLLLVLALFSVAACSTNNAVVSPEVAAVCQDDEYRLGTGDQLRITVFGQEDISREVEVDSAGRITLPLIGDFLVIGRTLKDVEKMLVDALTPDYFKNPVVSVEVLEYRDFFILGEVANPGPYPYVGKMTVITAVAMAGGFTYRAVKDEFLLQHDGRQISAGKETCVLPGDVIEVRERFF